jgi:hypothetical protein
MMTDQAVYRIRIKGRLDASWSDWFTGLEISMDEDGHTVLTGSLRDQSELNAVLNRLHQLALTLISIEKINGD